jgi:hypothetical protein
MWPFKRKSVEPIEAKSAAGGSTLFFGMGGGSGMQRSAEAYARRVTPETLLPMPASARSRPPQPASSCSCRKPIVATWSERIPCWNYSPARTAAPATAIFFDALITWRLTSGDAFVVRLPWGEEQPSKGKPVQGYRGEGADDSCFSRLVEQWIRERAQPQAKQIAGTSLADVNKTVEAGIAIPLDEEFNVVGMPMDCPGDRTAPAALVWNHRCSLYHSEVPEAL